MPYLVAHLSSMFDFVGFLIRANLRNLQSLAISVGTPVAILAVFALQRQQHTALAIFPMILSIAVIFGGVTLGTRILNWNDQKIFRRLAVTPVPLPYLLTGLLLAQLIVNILQSVLVLILGMTIGIELSIGHFILAIVLIVVATFTFTALGPLVATFIQRIDLYNYAYIFLLLPTTFVGGLPGMSLPPAVNQIVQILPTTLFMNLFQSLTAPLDIAATLLRTLLLLAYGIIFLTIASLRFQWN